MNAGWTRVHAPWACALVLCGLQFGATVYAQPGPGANANAGEEAQRAQAKQRFEQAVADYDAERYEQALANFQEAFRLRPHPLVNVNIANCYDKLGKPLQAIFHFERFLESEVGAPAQRAEVKNALERLRKQVGQLLLRITPDGATVLIDQGEQRRSPVLEPIRLEAGAHSLEVRLSGYRTVHRSVSVDGGSTLELAIALEPETGAGPPVLSVTPTAEVPATAQPSPAPIETAAAAAQAPAAASPDGGPSAGVWVGGALTVVLALTGTITGVLALSAESDFEQKKEEFAAEPSPLARIDIYNAARDDADRADALALTTDLLLGGALIGAVVTTYLLLAGGSDDSSEHANARIAPSLAPTGGGFQVDGRF